LYRPPCGGHLTIRHDEEKESFSSEAKATMNEQRPANELAVVLLAPNKVVRGDIQILGVVNPLLFMAAEKQLPNIASSLSAVVMEYPVVRRS
jgi:hypothetical protein